MKSIPLITLFALVLNLEWELLQAPLYGHTLSWEHLLSCLRAGVGDVVIIAAFYAVLSKHYKNPYWFHKLTIDRVITLVLLGAFTATAIEIHALWTDRWSYTAAMPLLPILKIGITPLLQMMILPLLLAFVSRRLTIS